MCLSVIAVCMLGTENIQDQWMLKIKKVKVVFNAFMFSSACSCLLCSLRILCKRAPEVFGFDMIQVIRLLIMR